MFKFWWYIWEICSGIKWITQNGNVRTQYGWDPKDRHKSFHLETRSIDALVEHNYWHSSRNNGWPGSQVLWLTGELPDQEINKARIRADQQQDLLYLVSRSFCFPGCVWYWNYWLWCTEGFRSFEPDPRTPFVVWHQIKKAAILLDLYSV